MSLRHAIPPVLRKAGLVRMIAERSVESNPAPYPLKVARLAVDALVREALLTPKPGLVDRRSSGTHTDMNLDMMLRSARSLFPCFLEIAKAASHMRPSQAAREQLAVIGRRGETAMFSVTGGINTHKGAIWALGLLAAGAVMASEPGNPYETALLAGEIAGFADRGMLPVETNGARAKRRFGAKGARGQAEMGFPHVVGIGLPVLHASRLKGASEDQAQLDALLAIMAELDDTCLLHRGGEAMLHMVKSGAKDICLVGGITTHEGQRKYERLEARMLQANASPGGSADLLAATIFLDSLAGNT